ncbi:hypothetical protein BCR37DRAFT_387551 [Protomyces lactucae-debilis]|uniref:Rhodopsin domain-containing protein n=1 Tax=Protomyces lactucae-debilis TaxID=2754530 RepID=A0A1Y2FFA2_PROLT|nr:uncharacterized protein BCR37DRAFT_387551 [Protomyces lactucae-debilis]ORY82084.1 hypothetical protein BCR37DRAFT_387551 [Protomyces lactucae-debilis]
MIWPILLLMTLASCFLVARCCIKIYRHLLRRDIIQEGLLWLAWSATIPTSVLAILILTTEREDRAAYFLLVAHYLSIFIAHLTKASLALLFIHFAQLREYKLINQCIIPIIGLSLTLNLVALSVQCNFQATFDGETGPEQCHFEGVAMVESLFNILLGIMLVMHPIKPLYKAASLIGKQNVVMLSCLFGTAMAGSFVSVMRAVVAHRQSTRVKSAELLDDDIEEAINVMSRVRTLALLLVLEACLGIVLAAVPDMGGLYLHWYHQGALDLSRKDTTSTEDSAMKCASTSSETRPDGPNMSKFSAETLPLAQKASKLQKQKMDQFLWGFDGSPDRWNKMPSLHHLPLHSTGRIPKLPLAKLPSTTLPDCTHSNTVPAKGD